MASEISVRVDGDTFTHEEENMDEIVYAIGVNLARFHHFTRASAVLKDLHRPVYFVNGD